MKKLDLVGWAAIAEIIGSAAVILSLVFVGISIQQNTAVYRATNDNLLYEMSDAWYSDLATNPELNRIWAKFVGGDSLTDADKATVSSQLMRSLNVWELAYIRFHDGLMPPDQWDMWNRINEDWIRSGGIPQELWTPLRSDFNARFVQYVDSIYESK